MKISWFFILFSHALYYRISHPISAKRKCPTARGSHASQKTNWMVYQTNLRRKSQKIKSYFAASA